MSDQYGVELGDDASVDDFIKALVSAVDIQHMEYPINVGQGEGYSIKESALLIQEAIGYDGDIIFDTSKTDGDPVKVMSKSNFIEKFPDFKFYNHREGIKNTVNYYKEKLWD